MGMADKIVAGRYARSYGERSTGGSARRVGGFAGSGLGRNVGSDDTRSGGASRRASVAGPLLLADMQICDRPVGRNSPRRRLRLLPAREYRTTRSDPDATPAAATGGATAR